MGTSRACASATERWSSSSNPRADTAARPCDARGHAALGAAGDPGRGSCPAGSAASSGRSRTDSPVPGVRRAAHMRGMSLENVGWSTRRLRPSNLGDTLPVSLVLQPRVGVHLAGSWRWRATSPVAATTASSCVEALHEAYWDLTAEVDDVRDLGEVTVTRVRAFVAGAGGATRRCSRRNGTSRALEPQERNPVARLPERGRGPRGRRACGVAP